MFHSELDDGDIHLVYTWEYADATARVAATGFVALDVGKLARQLDNNTLWMLTATTPTWQQVGGGAAWGSITGTLSAQADLQTALDEKLTSIGGRLTPTSNTPEEHLAINATSLYYTPHVSDKVALYNGTRWVQYTFTEKQLKLTDTQNGSTQNGINTITGLTDTSQFIVGMVVTGANIAANSVVNTIDSATQVTLNNNCTGTGTVAITFKFLKDSNYDVFIQDVGAGVLKLKTIKWTNATTRATALVFQDRRRVKTGDTTWLYLGCFRTNTSDGQTNQYSANRYVWNEYNRIYLNFHFEVGGGHPYTLNVCREWGAAEARLKFIYGGYERLLPQVSLYGGVVAGMLGVGFDTIASIAYPQLVGVDINSSWTHAFGMTFEKSYPAGTIGWHWMALLEQGNTTANGYFSSPLIGFGYNW